MPSRSARVQAALRAFAIPGAIALLLVGALWSALLYDARRGVDAALEQARKDALNLAVAFREHISGTVNAIDQLLIAIAAEHAQHPQDHRLPSWVAESPLLGGLALQVSMVGPDGIIRASKLGMSGTISVADRPHFLHHRDPAAAQPYISAPVLGRVSGQWSVQFTRRLTRPDGQFDGVVTISVDPLHLSGFFNDVDLGANGVATLVGQDGVVRARSALANQSLAQSVVGSVLFERARAANSGTYVAVSQVDAVERIYGFANIRSYPLIVALGLSKEEAIAPARHQQQTYLQLGAAGTAAILMLTFVIAWQSQRRRRQEIAAHAQHKVAEQHETLDLAMRSIAQGLCMFDASGRIVLCNRRYLEIYSLSPDIVKPGCTLDELIAHRQATGLLAGDPQALRMDILTRAGRGVRTARTVEMPDGRSVHVVQTPLRGGGWVATHEDITERDRMEKALSVLARAAEDAARDARDAHKRLREAIEVVPEGFALFDADDRYVLWNEQYLKLYPESAAAIKVGVRFEDVLRVGLAQGQYAEAKGREEAWLAERLARHREMESSHEQRLPGDRWVRVQERRTADGGSVGVRVDITDLKRREDSFKLLFDSNPVPMFVLSLDTMRFLAANDAALDFYGYSREQFLELSILDIRPEEDRARIADQIRSQGRIRRATPSRHQRVDGAVRDVEIFSRFFEFRGEPARIAAVIDTTERKAIERQLQHAQKMEAVGSLTGGLAHDFNNLLTIIIGNLDLLQDEISEESARAKLTTILEASERGAQLTRQMLAFSRRQPLQPKRLDCNKLVDATAQLLARTLGESIRIELRTTADVWPAVADEAQLESALVNIAINARDAMPEGGSLIIETHNGHLDTDYAAHHPDTRAGDYVVIVISDTGTGMPADVRERVFEPFYTTKAVGKGTGLGLSMVYGFVKQSGGHITVYSELGKGTTFKLYLPRAISEEELVRPQLEAARPDAVASDKVILAVDDSPSVRATVVARLTGLGYRVLEADGPAAALEQIERNQPIDLLFTDIVMPGGMSGKQLATLARAKCPQLKVLFTSGFPGSMLSGGSELEHGDRLLSKPYRKNDLARAVSEALADA